MSNDASFHDGDEAPLRLMAQDVDDLKVMAALVQDAVFPGSEMRWQSGARRFAILLNRFRWEDPARRTERVQSVLSFEDVRAVRSQGISRDAEMVLSVLSLTWVPGEDGTGRVEVILAGDGAIALDCECLNAQLRDVTRPYTAPSRKRPDQGEEG